MKRKISAGRLLSIIGTLILCAGLICSGFELVSDTVFRGIVGVGAAIHVLALICILKRKEF